MPKYGFIYRIISPDGKSYIGQVVEYLKCGRKKGVKGRWKQHINSAKRKKGCPYLKNAINKYGPENLKISILMKTTLDKLDLFEELYIKVYNTIVPNGYNLQTGGTFTKHSEETCRKRSNSMKKLLEDPIKRKIWSNAKLGVVQKKKRKCKKYINQNLPKYIYYRESHGGKYKGYVVEHPLGNKRFSKSKNGLETNLRLAKEYILKLETGKR